MDVAVSELRAHLKDWLARASDGEEVVVTERGLPVARIVGIESSMKLAELTEQGVISKPAEATRPRAAGRPRPRSGRPVSELVSEQRR